MGDKQHGRGQCFYADGSVYDGEWKEGVRCGQGKLIHGEFTYTGGWVDDKPEGQGACKEENGDKYVGKSLFIFYFNLIGMNGKLRV